MIAWFNSEKHWVFIPKIFISNIKKATLFLFFHLAFSFLSSFPHLFIFLIIEGLLIYYLPFCPSKFLLKTQNILFGLLLRILLHTHLFGCWLLVSLCWTMDGICYCNFCLTLFTEFITEREEWIVLVFWVNFCNFDASLVVKERIGVKF